MDDGSAAVVVMTLTDRNLRWEYLSAADGARLLAACKRMLHRLLPWSTPHTDPIR